MKYLKISLGLILLLTGSFIILFTFAFSTLVDPELKGMDWWIAVARTMLRSGLFELTLGLTILVGGIWLLWWPTDARMGDTFRPRISLRQLAIMVAVFALLLAMYALSPAPREFIKGPGGEIQEIPR
jgi:hypothetical protein